MSLSLYRAATKKPFGMLSGGQRYVAKVSGYDMRWPSCAVCTVIESSSSLVKVGEERIIGLLRIPLKEPHNE